KCTIIFFFFFSSRRRHTRSKRDWSSDVCSSDLAVLGIVYAFAENSASTDQLDLFRSTDGGLSWTALGVNAKIPANPNADNPNMRSEERRVGKECRSGCAPSQ